MFIIVQLLCVKGLMGILPDGDLVLRKKAYMMTMTPGQ